jgi:hypothetical protein
MNDDRVVNDITANAALRTMEDGSALMDSIPYACVAIAPEDGTVQQAVAANVWETMNFVHRTPCLGITADLAANTLTTTHAGIYEVVFSCSMTSSGNAVTYRVVLSRNGVRQRAGCDTYFVLAAQFNTLAFNYFIEAAAGDVFTVDIQASANDTATIRYAQLSMTRLGANVRTPA